MELQISEVGYEMKKEDREQGSLPVDRDWKWQGKESPSPNSFTEKAQPPLPVSDNEGIDGKSSSTGRTASASKEKVS